VLGGWLGAVSASWLERFGALARWGRIRARWFVGEIRGALALLALWPVVLLFPLVVPLGLGQVLDRVLSALEAALQDTPFLQWLPARDMPAQWLVPQVEFFCVALGLLIPCLLGYCIVRAAVRRAVFALLTVVVGIAMTSLSAALTYGPQHAWEWVYRPVLAGLVTGLVLALVLVRVPHRAGAALALLAMGMYLSLLNQAPADPYFTQTLQTWEQGRFIRFHGLVQWLGWLWPYAALVYLLQHIWIQDREN